MKICSWQFFDLKSSYHWKFRVKFLNLKFKFYKTVSDVETIKIKLLDLKKLCNFIVGHIFKWTHLVP
jgi:hypothetical protein